jgi:hypothetical protein
LLASAPYREAPVRVTVLPLPAAAVPNVAVPPSRETSSFTSLPDSVLVSTVAELFPSYTLSSAVKWPTTAMAPMSALVVCETLTV